MKLAALFFIILIAPFCEAQDSLDELLEMHNKKKVSYISVEEAKMAQNNKVIFLDAREISEFEVSHLKDAIFVGYDTFSIEDVIKKIPNKKTSIIVYCSLGIRSETVALQLKKAGYTNVKNLYGGIFQWKDKGYTIYNSNKKPTDSIHAFSPQWGKWATKGIKVYE